MIQKILGTYTKRNLLIWIVGAICTSLTAQIDYRIESEAIGSRGDNAPFWLVNNRQGISSLQNNSGYLRAGITRNADTLSQLSYRLGLDVLGAAHYYASFIVQQAYVDLLYKKMELSIGSKERYSFLKNQALSSGGMSWSGNARPIPQVRLSLPEFVSFPWLLRNRLKLKGSIAYGWFTDQNYQEQNVVLGTSPNHTYNKNVLYHHKDFEAEYDFKNSPWAFTLGIENDVQFCGQQIAGYGIQNTPANFKHYLLVLLPLPGDKSSAAGDQAYVFGNTMGSWHTVLHYRKPTYEWKAYLENFFEDFGGLAKENGFDGLWGIEYARKEKRGVTGVVFEYLQTTNQSGPIHWAPNDTPDSKLKDQATGNDDYYNNYYYTGWQHWGMTSGNPLLTSPIYNKNGSLRIQNNRVRGFHLGISNSWSKSFSSRLLATYSQGWGRYYLPFEEIKSNTSLLLETNYAPRKFQGWLLTLGIAADRGTLYGDNSGVSIKIAKTTQIGR